MSDKLKIYFKQKYDEQGRDITKPVQTIANNERNKANIMRLLSEEIMDIRDADEPAPKVGKKATAVTEVLLNKNKMQEKQIADLQKQIADLQKQLAQGNAKKAETPGNVGFIDLSSIIPNTQDDVNAGNDSGIPIPVIPKEVTKTGKKK